MGEKLLVPIYLPSWLHSSILRVKRALIPAKPRSINILGERDVEWTFLGSEMPSGPGKAMEFGCEHGYLSLLAAEKGMQVLAIDLEHQTFEWEHPLVEFRQGDFLKLDLPRGYFDVVINCSSVEHVGIAGRYGITVQHNDGDLMVMKSFAQVLKPGGLLLMTAPCGVDAVLAPWCRVYGKQRLPKLFEPFEIVKQRFWVKNPTNQWIECSRETALAFKPHHDPSNAHGCSYALGCFVLRTPTISQMYGEG